MKNLILAFALIGGIGTFNAMAEELHDPTFGEGAVTVINDQDCQEGLYDPTFCNDLIVITDLEQVKDVLAPIVRLKDPTFERGAVLVVRVNEQGQIELMDPTFEKDTIEIIKAEGEEPLLDPTFEDDAITIIE